MSEAKLDVIVKAINLMEYTMTIIGAGLDRLAWTVVSDQIHMIFDDTNIEVLVCKL